MAPPHVQADYESVAQMGYLFLRQDTSNGHEVLVESFGSSPNTLLCKGPI